MGRAYERSEQYGDAIAQIEKAINDFPRNKNVPNYQFFLAQLYYLNDDAPSAIETYRKIADNPTFGYDTRRSAQYSIGKNL